MENDYEKSVGFWEHKIGDITHRITPEEQDNIDFVRVRRKAEKEGEEALFQGVIDIYVKMVVRESPTMEPKKQKQLRNWVGLNIKQIIHDMMIAYKWTTEEELTKIQEKAIKEEMQGNQKKTTIQ